ncbi:RfbA dTDP-glucose pyrophosphorylase [Candidatus Nanopelagicaceae bacterium]
MKNIQLVIPMAGKGQRFADAGYTNLKPMLPIHGVPMISVVLKNLYSHHLSDVILICQRETLEKSNLRETLDWLDIPLTILCVDSITEGPADTVRLARMAIRDDQPLVIANSDQFINGDLTEFYEQSSNPNFGGVVLTMTDDDPKWSFARVDNDQNILEIREKKVISNNATVGIYGFSRADIAWGAFSKMWEAGDRTNGEYYVAPSYNYFGNSTSRIINLGPINQVMFGLGVPEDYMRFLEISELKNNEIRIKSDC